MKQLSVCLALAVLPAPTFADIQHNGKTIDCYCTDTSGGRIELGEKICLQVDGKMFMAQCQMSLNVPMWRKIEDGCLSSQRLKPRLNPRPVYSKILPAKS
ncbi:hypothetical protein N4R57_07675 [Rhodobacteraceae bacterium D3-12]|nr:hypothetical protein N4R57_07675 [Rhodobacteraceae bacterium D3-12]